MAIIRASRTFEGGEMKQSGGGYLKSGTRTMNFRDKNNIEGVYVFILEAYKEDAAQNGVWYKPLKIRADFGLDQKEKFAVQPNCPVDYFASKVKTYAPDFAKSQKVKRDNREMTVYPAYGRVTWRALYNAIYLKNPDLGIHVLDLPMNGGASVIDEYVKGKSPDGADNPRLNDYQAAIPVYIKLDLTAQGQPWKLVVKEGKTYSLEEQYADTENLYNLDNVVMYPSKEELLEKLRMVVPLNLFNQCMAGYSDGTVKVSFNAPAAASTSLPDDDDIPFNSPLPTALKANPAPRAPVAAPRPTQVSSVAPAFNMPKARQTPIPVPEAQLAEPEADADADLPVGDDADMPRPPVTTTSTATLEKAKAWLKRPVSA